MSKVAPVQKTVRNCLIAANDFVSGDVVCPSCQHICSFSAIQNFFDPKTVKSEKCTKMRDHFLHAKPPVNRFQIEDIDAGAAKVSDMSMEEVDGICDQLGMEKITFAAFENLNAYCNLEKRILYFPLKDVDGFVVGYKKLSKNNNDDKIREETIPESNSFGVVIATTKRLTKDQAKHAIIVVNVLDTLAIRMQKAQGECRFE